LNILAEKLTVPYSFAPAYMNRQRAAVVGTLGIQYYKAGKFETAEEHRPDYLRVSQAERERAQREKEAEIIVRELKVEDSAAVAEMEQQIFSDPWSEKSVMETVQQKQSVCFAAEKAGHILGYLLELLNRSRLLLLKRYMRTQECSRPLPLIMEPSFTATKK
jgi:hypothetical protein